tara:strand:- start:1072 stop:1245 length:174 start_codon:yes stop_codon:yes gene_type:complete
LLKRVEDGKGQIEGLNDELKLAENEVLKQKMVSRDVDDKRQGLIVDEKILDQDIQSN